MMTRKVSTSSIKLSLFKFRRLVLALVFLFAAQAGWSATYYWVGDGSNNDWSVTNNWATSERGTPGAGVPGTGDSVYIYGNVNAQINSNISISNLYVQSAINDLTDNFTTTLSGSGQLYLTGTGDSINLTRCAGNTAPDAIGTLQISLPVTCTGSIQTHSGTTLLVDNGVTLKAANVIHSASSGKPLSKIHIGGTLDVGTGTINLCGNGNPGATQLVVAGGTVIAGSIVLDPPEYPSSGDKIYSNTSSDGTTTIITEPIINNGTIQVSNSFTIQEFTNTGTFTPYSGSGTIKLNGTNATFENKDTNHAITITTLTGEQPSIVKGGGKTTITTATFNGTATVEDTEIGTATFKQTATVENATITTATFEGSTTTLNGTNTFTNLTASNLGGKTLTINGSQSVTNNFALSGTNPTKLTVEGNGSLSLTNPLIADSLNFTGTGPTITSGTAYASNSSYSPAGAPTGWIVVSANQHVWNGSDAADGLKWDEDANWLPQSKPVGSTDVIINSSSYNPVITSDVTVNSITMNGASELTVNGDSTTLNVNAITLNNNSKITVNDSAKVQTSSVSIDTSASIEVNSTTSKFEITANATTLDNKITGPGTLVLSSGKSYTIPVGQTFDINIENNGTLAPSESGTVIFGKSFVNEGGLSNFDASVSVSIAGDLKNESSANFAGTVQITGKLINNSSATFTGGVSVGGDLTNGNSATFNGNVNVSGNFKDSGNGLTGTITLTGTGNQEFTSRAADAEYSVAVVKSSGNVEFKNPLTLTSLAATTTNFSGTIIFSGDGIQTLTAQNAEYKKISVAKSAGSSFVTTNVLQAQTLELTGGKAIFGGNVMLSTAADFTTTDNIEFTGGASLSPLTLSAPSIKTAGSIVCTDGGEGSGDSFLKLESTSGNIEIGGNLGSTTHYYDTVTLDADSNDISVGGSIYTENIEVVCDKVDFTDAIYVGSVNVTATTSVSIKGITASSLTINSSPQIKMGKTIEITGSNPFVINYPLLLTENTIFKITNDLIINGSGSIKSDSPAGKNLTLTANSISIAEGNPLGDNSTGKLGTITIKSPLVLGAATEFYSTETIFAETGTLSGEGSLVQNGNLTNSGTWSFGVPITVDGNITNSSTGTATITKDISVTGDVTDSGTWYKTSEKKLTFNGTGTQTFTPKNGTQYPDVVVSNTEGRFSTVGTVKADSFTATGNIEIPTAGIETTGNVTFNGTVNSSTSLSIKAANLTFSNDITVKDITMEATATTSHDMTVYGNWTNKGSFTASESSTVTFINSSTLDESFADLKGENSFYNLDLQRSVKIYNDNTVTNEFKAHKPRRGNFGNLQFAAGTTQTVNTLNFKGISNNNDGGYRQSASCITDGGTWNLKCTNVDSTVHTLQFVNLKGCNNEQSSYTLVAKESKDEGGNVKIIFPGYTYTWNGKASTQNWDDAGNWTPNTIPGIGSIVVIDVVEDGLGYQYPKLSDPKVLKDTTYSGTIEVKNGATFDLADKNLIVGTITNNGLVKLVGKTGQIDGQMVNGDPSTVEYYSASFETFAWDGGAADGKQYNNLVISEAITQPDGEVLDVAVYTKILSGATVTLDNSSNVFTGNVQIGTSSSSKPGTVTLNGTGTSSAAIFLDENIYADSLVLNSKIQGAKLNVYAPLTINANGITSTDDQTYNETVTLGTDITFDTAANKTITFLNNIQGTSGTEILTANKNLVIGSSGETISVDIAVQAEKDFTNNAAITFEKDITAKGNVTDNGTWTQTTGTLIFTGTGEQTFTPKGTVTTYNSILINKAGGSFSTITNALSAASFTDHTGSSNSACTITFNKDVTIKSDVELTTTGEVTFATGNTYIFKDDSDNYKDFKHVTASTKLNGTILAKDIKTGDSTANPVIGTTVADLTISKAENVYFDGPVQITKIADTATAGNIYFKAGGSISDDTTLLTTGDVNITGTLDFGTHSFTHTAATGTSSLKGTIKAGAVTLGNLTIVDKSSITSSAEITTADITLDSGATEKELTLTSSTGTFTTGDIGTSVLPFTKVTFNGVNAALSYSPTPAGKTIYTTDLNFTTTGDISVSDTKVVGITTINTASTINLENLESSTILFTGTNTTGTVINLTGTIKSDNSLSATAKTINVDGALDFPTDKTIRLTGETNFSSTGTSSVTNTPLFITGPLTNSGATTFNGDVSVTGNVTDSGTWTQTTGTLIFTGTGEQTFTPKGTTTYNSILINKAGGSFSTITNALSAASFTDHTGSSASACTITFNKGITIKSDVELTTTGEVTFATGNTYTFKDDSDNYKDFKHVTASTKLNGTVSANDITLDNTTITNLTIQKAADVTFGGTVSGGTLTITEAANTTFNGSTTITNFSDTATAGNITFTNTSPNTAHIENAASFTTNGTVTFNGTFLSPSLSVANEASVTGTVRTDTTQIYSGNLTGGTMTLEGTTITLHESLTPTGTANFGTTDANTNVFIDNSSTANLGESSGNTVSVIINGNLIIHNGTITANTNVSATKDIIILGSNYSDTDNTTTNISKEFAYNCPRPSGWSQPKYTDTLPSTHTAELKVKAGKVISAGINFYANGTTLSEAGGSGEWTLKIPDVRYSNTTNKTLGFAEAYFSDISGCNVVCSAGNTTEDTDGTKARLITLRCDDSGTNTNVDFGNFIIEEAYTVRDNAIYVRFNRPVRYHSGTIASLKFQNGTATPALSFEGVYSKPDCREQDKLKYDTELSYFYIKASAQDDSILGAWNTDATGTSAGTTDESTDRSGVHHNTKPCLDFPRALAGNDGNVSIAFVLTDRWGKRLTNYSSRANGTTYTTVLDHTGPVLYSVRTGQELHQELHVGNSPDPANDEHAYDSHNFIEFRYSEQVDFVGSDNDADLNDLTASENIQVTDSLGAVLGDITQAGNLEIAGLGIIQNGKIHTGRNGSTDRYVNALYRLDDYSIRLSIAGYVDGTVTDSLSNEYKNWVGYIEDAVQVSGTVTLLVDTTGNIGGASGRVKDRAATPNWQIKYENNASNFIPNVNRSISGVYGDWDISEPIFAIIRQNNRKVWEQALFTENYQSEAIGNPMGGTTLDRIEFHLFDNTPFDNIPAFENVTDDPEWFTEVGWGKHDSSGTKDPNELYFYNSDTDGSFAADIFGGARPFANGTTSADNAAYRTSGGIRYSSLISSAQGFKYGIGSASPTTAFDEATPVYSGATSLIFAGASTPRRGADDLEGLYFGLPLADRSLDVKTSFTVKYDDTKAYITDLAGNRLRSKTITTIDRTPPSIDMTISPIGADEVEIIFVKELITDSSNIHYILNDTTEDYPISEPFEYLISQCLDIITIDDTGKATVASDLAFDTAAPAKVWVTSNSTNSSFTHIKLKLSRAITLEDIETKFIRITHAPNYAEESRDLFTQQNGSRVTFIQDENGNTIQMYTAHALSDFAVSAVSPLYAYDSALTWDDGTIISENLWYTNTTDEVDPESWAVHDWNRDQKNFGTLPAGHTVAVVADSVSPNINIYVTNHPDEESDSGQANKAFEFEIPWRIWIPDVTSDVFRALAEKNNTEYSVATGTLLDGQSNRLIFDLDSQIVSKWSGGDQVTFLFGLMKDDGTPVTIMHSPELNINQDKYYLTSSTKMPLYALRQTDPEDFMSLDLWSFRIKDIINQRGGVTILNNAINSVDGEKVVIKVNQPQAGNLNVLVMTLDGNIVDYLHRGASEAGEHYFSWNGSNRKGNPVARGMYFIRVTGPGIDETRKVLVVK